MAEIVEASETIVQQYISADRSIFVSSQFYIKLLTAEFWVDIAAASFKERHIYFGEVTFNKNINSISKKIVTYFEHQSEIIAEMATVASIPTDWNFRPWLFMTREGAQRFVTNWSHSVYPKITYLEMTLPWLYPNGYRESEPQKPYPDLPPQFQ